MASYKPFLWTNYVKSNGEHPIYLRVTKDRKQKYIKLDMSALPKQWNVEHGRFISKTKDKHPDYLENNAFLLAQENKAKEIIDEFERNKIDWTINQFEEAFFHRAKKGKVKAYFENLIQTLRNTGHTGNAICYERTLKMLELFDKKFEKKVFSEIDLKFVRTFDTFLQTPRQTTTVTKTGKTITVERAGCAGNTRKYYFRALRALMHRAISDNEASEATFPFGKNGFNVGELEEETAKRYLPTDYMMLIKTTVSGNKMNEYARKLFLFSYYSHGMSFIDMAHLTFDNLQRHEEGQYLVYKRIKTLNSKNAKSIRIKVTDELQTIITELTELTKPVDNYLLPIVSIGGYSGETLYNHIRGRSKKYNGYLKQLAVELGIDDINLTSYVSRHTMAMTLQGSDIPREKIGQILGHKDLKTTNTYLDSFGSDDIDEAVKVL